MKRITVTIGNNSNMSQRGKISQHTFNKTEKGAKEYSLYEIQSTVVLWY
jgi:hypothetical protein